MTKQLAQLATLRQGAIVTDPACRMAVTVGFACQAFVGLLTIHPFANGNGHVADSGGRCR
jgi:hypothetical protein